VFATLPKYVCLCVLGQVALFLDLNLKAYYGNKGTKKSKRQRRNEREKKSKQTKLSQTHAQTFTVTQSNSSRCTHPQLYCPGVYDTLYKK